MKFNIKSKIQLDSTIEAEKLLQILEPENRTPDETQIISSIEQDQVITEIKGKMSIGTLLRSIDDILVTANLATTVANTTNQES